MLPGHPLDPRPLPPDAPDYETLPPVVFGTAGHVDHGKSTLVEALTGIDPDRLAEEKARAMTIDLGFAWLTLPDGRTASIVDVPGHERFIKNMLAGAGGIDAAILVIAADDGPMPQTREHLAILDLLGIEHGLIALTKIDLADRAWLDLVAADTAALVAGTSLSRAPIVPVSARTGAGLDAFHRQLGLIASQIPRRGGDDRPRLPIDRAFTMAGFGTVVTGTLGGGDLRLGQELRLYPAGPLVRVRGLQTHRTPVARAGPGSRVAVNLAGITVEQVRRGDVLAADGLLRPSHRVDARVRLLPGSSWRLEQNAGVDVFVGAAERAARVTLLDRDVLEPGDTGWVQLRLEAPVAVLRGDRFILRRPSPGETMGGGEIVDPSPPKHRRFRPEVLAALETLAAGHPVDILRHVIADQAVAARTLRDTPPAGLKRDQVEPALAELIAGGDIQLVGRDSPRASGSAYLLPVAGWRLLRDQLSRQVAAYHAQNPLRRGMPREQLRAGLGVEPALLDAALRQAVADGAVIEEEMVVRLPSFRIELSPEQAALAGQYLLAITAIPHAPPSPAAFGLDDELLAALEHLGDVVRIGPGIALTPAALATLRDGALAIIDAEGSISLARFRDQFATSRKYAQAMLEYLDRQRLTRRIGDERVRWDAGDSSDDSR